jgi:hypothetical protein
LLRKFIQVKITSGGVSSCSNDMKIYIETMGHPLSLNQAQPAANTNYYCHTFSLYLKYQLPFSFLTVGHSANAIY